MDTTKEWPPWSTLALFADAVRAFIARRILSPYSTLPQNHFSQQVSHHVGHYEP